MSFNTFGKIFRFTTWGESHGPAIGCVVDGCPPNIPLSVKDIQKDMDRRRPGKSKFTSQRKESDKVEVLSGVFQGRTTDQADNMELKTEFGGTVKIHKDGVDLLNAKGVGITMGTSGIHMDEPIDSTVPRQQGLLVDSSIKTWVGLPETIVTIPSWEKWPDINKIVGWANVIAFAVQAIDKIHRANEEMSDL